MITRMRFGPVKQFHVTITSPGSAKAAHYENKAREDAAGL